MLHQWKLIDMCHAIARSNIATIIYSLQNIGIILQAVSDAGTNTQDPVVLKDASSQTEDCIEQSENEKDATPSQTDLEDADHTNTQTEENSTQLQIVNYHIRHA